MRTVPLTIQKTAALLAALYEAPGEPPRVSDLCRVYGRLLRRATTADFDACLDGLIRRRYVRAADTRISLDEDGRTFLLSVAERVAADSAGAGAFGELTPLGRLQLQRCAANLPARYGTRGGDHFVYVVLLHHDVQRLRRFRLANARRRPELPALYVGMTGRAPLQRFRHHVQGRKSSRYVRGYGLCLLPELTRGLNPLDRSGAQSMEVDLAADLRRQGYGVMGIYEAGAVAVAVHV